MKANLLIIMLLSAFALMAQNEEIPYEIRLYYGIEQDREIELDQLSPFYKIINEEVNSSIGHISIGLKLEKDRLSHEFILSRLSYNPYEFSSKETRIDSLGEHTQPLAKEKMNSVLVRLRYELGLKTTKSKRFMPYITLGLEPFIQYSHIAPSAGDEFPLYNTQIGMAFRIVPHIDYSINEKVSLIASIPLDLMSLYYERRVDRNPALILPQQTSNNFNLEVAKNILNFYIGFGINI